MAVVKFRFQKPGSIFLLVVLLSATLLTLAVLQYRWIGQTSDRERERIRETARLAAENLSRDFDRELARAFLELQVDPISFEKKNWDNYASRYERWLASVPYPKLVSDVFIHDRDECGEYRLSVYDETTRRFEESARLPPQLARAQSQIERDLDGAETTFAVKTVAADVPALLIPISSVNLLDLKNIQTDSAQSGARLRRSVRRVGYTIVLLDFDYIKNELLPLLTARYFNPVESDKISQYDVIITNRDEPPQILYQSGSSPARTETSPGGDAAGNLFALRFDEIQSLLSAAPRRQAQSSKTNGEKQERNVSVSVVVAPRRHTDSATTADAGSPPDIQKGRWQLFVLYRGGSLEDAVETTRRRNLIVSFGILLLLAASSALLIVLLNRSQRFARRQTDFVASVTHELRTPLAVIRSMSENLADGIVADGEKIRQYGALINDEERRLSAMVENILGFAGARAAQNEPTKLRLQNVRDIIEAALEDYRTELHKRDFHVETVIEPELPPVIADADALRRAVGNLIGNAVKYSDRTRRIEITARAIGGVKSACVEIVVKDEGAGIDVRDLPDVFKLFYRGRQATERQIEGSGIGLSLVKQTVEAHGGTISVTSAPNQGSAFTITLPATAEITVAPEENLPEIK